MYRILHSADWHLGQTLHGFSRETEHEAALQSVLNKIDEERVDAVILAGDVYHVTNPPTNAVSTFFEFIRKVSIQAPNVDLVVIAGNHDSGARLTLPMALAPSDRVRILGAAPRGPDGPAPEDAVFALRDAAGAPRAALILLPYPRPGDLSEARTDPVDASRNRVAEDRPVRAFMSAASTAAQARFPDLPIVAVSHLHVAGGLAGSDSERPIVIGGDEAIPLSDFPESIDYVALGHLHRPQTLKGAPLAVYSGAPIPLSVDEAGYAQSVAIVDIEPREGARAAVRVRRSELPRTRAFLRIPEKGAAPLETVERLLETLAATLRGDATATAAPPFLEVVVALDEPTPDLRRRIDEALKDTPVRLIRIRRVLSGGLTDTESPDGAPPSPPTPAEAFARLHEAKFGGPPSEALSGAFNELAMAALNEDAQAADDRRPPADRRPARQGEAAE